MKITDFDYELPSELIAQQPASEREAARLLVHDRARDATEHSVVRDLGRWLRPGDLVVVNDTRVLPARLFTNRASGGRVEVLLLEPYAAGGVFAWRALLQPARRLKPGERLALEGGCVVLGERGTDAAGQPSSWWPVSFEDASGAALQDPRAGAEWLQRVGHMPLPPYIQRTLLEGESAGSDSALDRERYQTVFAERPGAVAAPTAGLHLTQRLLDEFADAGVGLARVTLHVGLGTFEPVRVDSLEEHRMHSERYELSTKTAQAVADCRARGGRVVAIGTTSTRVLEAQADGAGGVRPGAGETSLFLRPGSRFAVVDALLTNFHLPRSTLLVLVSAFVGREKVLELYREAIASRYRFYSYGDAMLLF